MVQDHDFARVGTMQVHAIMPSLIQKSSKSVKNYIQPRAFRQLPCSTIFWTFLDSVDFSKGRKKQ